MHMFLQEMFCFVCYYHVVDAYKTEIVKRSYAASYIFLFFQKLESRLLHTGLTPHSMVAFILSSAALKQSKLVWHLLTGIHSVKMVMITIFLICRKLIYEGQVGGGLRQEATDTE